MERARDFVHHQAERDMPRRQAAAPAPASRQAPDVQNEIFDPNNPVHYRLAASVLDHERIKSPAAREFKVNVLLKGCRVGDIGRIVREDQQAYLKNRSSGGRT